MVYEPLETRLLRDAEAAGCVTIDGLQMLLAQAVGPVRDLDGPEAPVDVMLQAALDLRAQEGGVTASRYSRQELFAGIGPEGQERMRAARGRDRGRAAPSAPCSPR